MGGQAGRHPLHAAQRLRQRAELIPALDGVVLTAHRDRATRSPFPGLQPFGGDADDAALFAGRDSEIELVAANLEAARLTILYGPSGVGKSSLLRAGVARQIEVQEAAARDAGKPASTIYVHDEWAGDPDVQLVRRIAQCWGEEHDGVLLLVFDQFEEYLRLHPESEHHRLDELLPELVQDDALRVHVLISLREDALAEMDRFEVSMPRLFDNVLRLPPMTATAARDAIEKPIAKVNEWRAEAGLAVVEVEQDAGDTRGIVGEVLDQLADPDLMKAPSADAARRQREARTTRPGAAVETIEPAFLQLVMQRLWAVDAEHAPPVLSRATLKEIGGAAAIVRGHLDAAMAGLTSAQQDVAADVFGHLVTPSGAKIRYTAADLAFYAKRRPGEVADVLDALSDPELRIIRRVPSPTGEPDERGYEIFHDVLAGGVRSWAMRMSTRQLERRNRRLAAVVATLLAITVALVVQLAQPQVLQKLELELVDARFALRGDHQPDPKLAIVGIDDRTTSRLSPMRGDHARVLAAVARGRPAVIVEATEFALPGSMKNGGKAGTKQLVDAVRDASRRLPSRTGSRVLLATTRIDNDANTTLFGELRPKKKFYGADAGYAGRTPDADDAVRRVLYERSQPEVNGEPAKAMPSLAAQAAGVTGARLDKHDVPAWNDLAGGPGTYPHISFVDVLDATVDPARFRDRIVVIGTVLAEEDQGAFRAARGGGALMSSAETQANEIATLRAGLPLRDADEALTIALIVAFAVLAAGLAARFSTPLAAAAGAGAALLFGLAAQLAFNSGWVIAILTPLLALVVATIANPLIARAATIGSRP